MVSPPAVRGKAAVGGTTVRGTAEVQRRPGIMNVVCV